MPIAATLARFRRLEPGMELTITHRYRQPMQKVFAALSTPERIVEWMGAEWQGDPAPLKVGSNFSYTFGNSDMPSVGRVTAYDPPRLIEHTWFENNPPAAIVRWALEPDGTGCVLTLTQSYPDQDDAPRNGAGWTMIVGQLDAFLAGEPFASPEPWAALRDRYAREMGPEATRDGRMFTENGKPVVQFKRLVHAAPPEVWSWLTTLDKLKDWLGPVDIEPRVGGRFRIHFTMAPIVMDGTITAIDPPHRLELIWREPWFEADNVILAIALEPYGADTLLTLTHTFPEGYDPFEYQRGWHEFMDALEQAMGGEPFVWDTPERKAKSERLKAVYAAVRGAGG